MDNSEFHILELGHLGGITMRTISKERIEQVYMVEGVSPFSFLISVSRFYAGACLFVCLLLCIINLAIHHITACLCVMLPFHLAHCASDGHLKSIAYTTLGI